MGGFSDFMQRLVAVDMMSSLFGEFSRSAFWLANKITLLGAILFLIGFAVNSSFAALKN
jgi:hypothetical protein